MSVNTARKAVGLVITGIPVWGAAATAENGVDKGEWWALVALVTGAFMVWWIPNETTKDPAPEPWVPPERPV